MQGKNKYVYVVIGAYNEPCKAFFSESKANDYALWLECFRKKCHFDDIKIKVLKLCLE